MMKRSELFRAADPTGYASSLSAMVSADPMHHHESIRTDEYRGHKIVVRTMYSVEIDGKPITAELHVDNAGNVMCHAIPVYRTASMLELMRILVDVFPDDFPLPRDGAPRSGPGHDADPMHMGGHGGGH